MPNYDALNGFFVEYPSQFVEPILNTVFIQDPYSSLVKRKAFDMSDGLIQKVTRTTCAKPTAYPFNLEKVKSSDGATSACKFNPKLIASGFSVRDYTIYKDSYNSDTICFRDLHTRWHAENAVRNYQQHLGEYSTMWWADYHRVQNIGMIDKKASTTSNADFDVEENSDFDFAAVPVPTAPLEWDHLNKMYDQLLNVGAGQNAVGYSEGQPVLTVSMGAAYKRKLWQKEKDVRETVNYGDAFKNFAARGINRAINGFIPNIDPFPIRYDANLNPVYPFINRAASGGGTESVPNPAWRVKAGIVKYEVVYVTAANIYEERVPSVAPTNFAGATFDGARSYIGDIKWINNKDNDKNPLGEIGYYYMEFQVGAKPLNSNQGFAVLTQALD